MLAPTKVGALTAIEFGPRLFKSMVEESGDAPPAVDEEVEIALARCDRVGGGLDERHEQARDVRSLRYQLVVEVGRADRDGAAERLVVVERREVAGDPDLA